jgi:2-polyprenyl-3-methyl-5-hydroxy-6-metoxy-1,4-benzoquinol methylase
MTQAVQACPLCQSTDTRVVRRISSEQAAQHHAPADKDQESHARLKRHIEQMWGRADSARIDCRNCGLGFMSPFKAGDAAFYEMLSDRTAHPSWKWGYQRTLEHLQQTRIAEHRTGKLLEIGAANGNLLEALGAAGWPLSDMTGLEYSGAGQRAMRAKNIEGRPVDVRQLAADKPFDVICMARTLEHMDQLETLFAKLEALSKPGTDLLIAVPNGDWQRRNEALGIGYDFAPNHITLWDPETIERLASRFGWAVRAIELEPVSRKSAALYAFFTRYFTMAEQPGTVANRVTQVANRLPGRHLSRAVKAIGAVTQPGCWKVAIQSLLLASPPPAIWAHLARP